MPRRRPARLSVLLWAATAPAALGLSPRTGSADELTPAALMARLQADPKGGDAAKLADEIRGWFGGKENLAKGPNPKVDETAVAWAIEAPGASGPPRVLNVDDPSASIALARVGDTDVYAAARRFDEGAAIRWSFEVDGKRLPHPAANPRQRDAPAQLEVYSTHPDSREKAGAPKGKVTQPPKLQSKIFEGTTRDWWVYVPAQYRKDGPPACVMVFQDGGGYKDFVPAVFDNLIAEGAMPVTVGVFVNPGTFEGGRSNRSFEYDTLSDQYARFLLEEALPETEKVAGVTLRRDAAGRAVAGISSGGICAWTAAWERPAEFSKVLSWVGSFTNIASGKTVREGGHNYEALIRKTPKKPIRVFLQDGENDLDNANGNWPLANQEMAKSLKFAGYDSRFVFGKGFHSNRHGRAVLPDSLRWLWRGWESETPK